MGTINAVIDGTAWNGFASSASIIGGFVGINGYTFPLPTPSNLNFRFASSAGTHTVGSGNAPFVQYNLTTMPAPVWQAGSGSGSGTVTVTTLTATGTSGSFSIIVGPICCGASGNKTITGTFNVRF